MTDPPVPMEGAATPGSNSRTESSRSQSTTKRPLTGMLGFMEAVADAKLKAPMKSVLFALVYHANFDTGIAYPSMARLAREAGMTARSARRLVRQAQLLGVLHVKTTGGGVDSRGRGRPSVYRLDTARLRCLKEDTPSGFKADTLSGIKAGEIADSGAPEPGQLERQSGSDATVNPDTVSGEQTKELSTRNNQATTTTSAAGVAAGAGRLQTGERSGRADVLTRLRGLGISNGTAERLANRCTVEIIEAGIDWRNRHARGADSPNGMLVAFLEDGTATAHLPEFRRVCAENAERAEREARERLIRRRVDRLQHIAREVERGVRGDTALAEQWAKMNETIGQAFGDVLGMAEREAIPDAMLFDESVKPNAVANALRDAARAVLAASGR